MGLSAGKRKKSFQIRVAGGGCMEHGYCGTVVHKSPTFGRMGAFASPDGIDKSSGKVINKLWLGGASCTCRAQVGSA